MILTVVIRTSGYAILFEINAVPQLRNYCLLPKSRLGPASDFSFVSSKFCGGIQPMNYRNQYIFASVPQMGDFSFVSSNRYAKIEDTCFLKNYHQT